MTKFKVENYKNVPSKELIADLKRAGAELKMTSVTIAEYQKYGRFPPLVLLRRFGVWAKALKEAGLEQRRAFGVTEKELLADLKRVASGLKKDWFSLPEYDKYGKFGSRTFSRKFGSWVRALEKAGLNTRCSPNITEEEILRNLGEVWIKLGRQPSCHETHRPLSKYSGTTYTNRFGTWMNALERFIKYAKAGKLPDIVKRMPIIPDKIEPSRRNAPDAVLISDLKRVASELKKDWLSMPEYDKYGKFHSHTLWRRFGFWSRALEKAGLNQTRYPNITEEELLRNLADVWAKLGRQPPASAMQKPVSKYYVNVYQKRFGSWLKALERFIKYAKTGKLPAFDKKRLMIPHKLQLRRRNIPDALLIADLKRVASVLKRGYVSHSEYRKHGKFALNTLYRRFGSWIKATEKAGLKAKVFLNWSE